MGLINDVKEVWKNRKKVYCWECERYEKYKGCRVGYIDNPIAPVPIYEDCEEKNKNNNCVDRIKKVSPSMMH